MSLKVAYITTARSDYGPAYWLIHDLFEAPGIETHLIVGGAHLSKEQGFTVREIEQDGWHIAAKIPFLEEEAGTVAHAKGAGRALSAYAELFAKMEPDLVMLHGDRYELLPIASAAVICQVPLAHLSGGDITGGAIDEQVRHALTKMAHLHFPSTKLSAKRIRQMGEEAWRIHHVGDPALDNFVRGELGSVEELEQFLGFKPDRNSILVTFHPVTLELEQMPKQIDELSSALLEHKGNVVITAPAPDPGSELIRPELQRLAKLRPNTVFVESLGRKRYKTLLRHIGVMVGNSSSGLIEAPCVPLPVVNIGSRQEGRDRAANVLDVAAERGAILDGIRTALSPTFRAKLERIENPYGDGHASGRILKALGNIPSRTRLLHKKFVPAID